ncbi:MAG: hypothetical protein IJT62_05330 [Oscillospiraceae bacterium]|nr:hypothetical protein [Oscillospiraceae bacterium]
MNEKEKLLKERLKLFDDAMRIEETRRVPCVSNAFTWKIFDSDLHISVLEATTQWDTDIMERIVREHIERYNFDAYLDLGTRDNFSYNQILGRSEHYIDESGNISAKDDPKLFPEEYEAVTENATMFQWCVVAPRVYGSLTFGQIEDAVKALINYTAYYDRMNNIVHREYGVPALAQRLLMHPTDNLISYYRGLKGFSLDMRRNPEKIEAYVEKNSTGFLETAKYYLQMPREQELFGIYTGFLGHNIMNGKQFARFFYPVWKKAMDLCIENEKSMMIYAEGSTVRIREFLQDIPKGYLCIFPETDDLFDLRRACPNACIAGGMSVDMLGISTKQECVDAAKNFVDNMGPGYIFSQNKMMTYRRDGTRENMLAVQEVVLQNRY